MKKFKLFYIALVSLAFAACEPNATPEQDNGLVKAIYQSLDVTPEQFTENMSAQGLHVAAKYDFMSYMSFTNVDLNADYNYEEQKLVGIFYKGDTINQITYDQYLNTDSFPAASYQLFSDVIANQGYTNWQGYYEDPTEVDIIPKVVNGKNYSSAQIAQNRKELCNKISNESLRQLNSSQYYVETFIYTHKDNSRWEGRICLFTSHYTSDKDEEKTTNNIKDIILLFSLDRIK